MQLTHPWMIREFAKYKQQAMHAEADAARLVAQAKSSGRRTPGSWPIFAPSDRDGYATSR